MPHNEERDAEEDIRFTDYEPQRESIRKWIAAGWRWVLKNFVQNLL